MRTIVVTTGLLFAICGTLVTLYYSRRIDQKSVRGSWVGTGIAFIGIGIGTYAMLCIPPV